MTRAWGVPAATWALHITGLLGNLTERWIEVQLAAGHRYDARLMGLETAAGAPRMGHWLPVRDRFDLWLAYKAIWRTGGMSAVWLASQFRGDRHPALLHVHYGPPAHQFRMLARALRVPLVASFYGHDATLTKYREQRLWQIRYRRLFRDAAAVVVEGPAMASRIEAFGCPADKLHVVRLPADAHGLAACRRPRSDGFRVAIAGRFAEKKGFDVAIEAFARAFKDRPDAELLIIGGGELEEDYRRQAASAGIESQVTWAGRLPFTEFMSRVATAHLGLYPSRTAPNGDSEGGAPVTLAEAQWLGVPAIVSDHDDLPFVAAPGSIVLAPRDVDGWTDALRALYESPAEVDRMRDAAIAFAQKEHSPAANADGRERVYDSVTGRRPAPTLTSWAEGRTV